MKYAEYKEMVAEFLSEWRRAPLRAFFRAFVTLLGFAIVAAFFSGATQVGKSVTQLAMEWLNEPVSEDDAPDAPPDAIEPERFIGPGTRMQATVDRVVDGDTVRVFLEDESKSVSLRLLMLDTEEVHVGPKPVTSLGRIAAETAQEFFKPGDQVEIEFPGQEPVAEALQIHRGSFGRLTVYLYKDGQDYQEFMIKNGLSPYFTKYGYSNILENHLRYRAAERHAQAKGLGIWDQVANNGSLALNYATLTTWWELRARIIETYRRALMNWPDEAPPLLSHSDYELLVEAAHNKHEIVLFAHLGGWRPLENGDVILDIGSLEKPLRIFVPGGALDGQGGDVIRLLGSRFVSEGETSARRTYAFIRGRIRMFPEQNGQPEIVLRSITQVSDAPNELISRF